MDPVLRVVMLAKEKRRTDRRNAGGDVRSDLAWQTHAAMEAWLARADLKASIMLALQGVAAILVITSRDVVLRSAWRWPVLVGAAGLGLLAIAICVTAGATVPVLGATSTHRREYPHHIIYFGHLRLWRPEDLAGRLALITPAQQTAMLAGQLVSVARINWRKHRLIQLSVFITIVVIVMLSAAAIGAQLSIGPAASPTATP